MSQNISEAMLLLTLLYLNFLTSTSQSAACQVCPRHVQLGMCAREYQTDYKQLSNQDLCTSHIYGCGILDENSGGGGWYPIMTYNHQVCTFIFTPS